MKHLSAIPDPPSKLRPEISHDLDAVVMRALAKDPDQRYASAEEMDADLARVARGASVSHETEEAMTQVLAGAGASLGADGDRARAARDAAAGAARLPPAVLLRGGRGTAARRGRSSSGSLAVAIAAVGGYLIYNKVIAAINSNTPVAVNERRRDLRTRTPS